MLVRNIKCFEDVLIGLIDWIKPPRTMLTSYRYTFCPPKFGWTKDKGQRTKDKGFATLYDAIVLPSVSDFHEWY
jgi:hypothetical protein